VSESVSTPTWLSNFLKIIYGEGERRSSLLNRIEGGHKHAVTPTVTLLELLFQSYRDQKEELAQKIFALATTYPKIE
jgi:hypothetical protein